MLLSYPWRGARSVPDAATVPCLSQLIVKCRSLFERLEGHCADSAVSCKNNRQIGKAAGWRRVDHVDRL